MKSAMQELIYFVKTELKLSGYEHADILNKCNTLLEKEKQQIIEAYRTGVWENFTAEQYYNKKFE